MPARVRREKEGRSETNDRNRDSRAAAEIKGLVAAIQARIPRLAGDSAAAAAPLAGVHE